MSTEETRTINGLTFLQFCNEIYGFFVINKETKTEVFRFQLYHAGFSIAYIKDNFNLEPRPKK